MTLYLKIFLLAIFTFFTDVNTYAQLRNVTDLTDVPSETLLQKSVELSKNKTTADSALVYSTVICSRYSTDLSKEEKITCVSAYINLWYIYFTHYKNFAEAYHNIIKAKEIRDEIQVDIPLLDMYLGCFYHFMADQNDDENLKNEALTYYKKAFKIAFEMEDVMSLNYTFYNILSLLFHDFEEIPEIWNIYNKAIFAYDNYNYKYNKMFYKAMLLIHQGKHNEALKQIDQMVTPTAHENLEARLKYMLLSLKSYVYEDKKDYVTALKYIKEAKDIAIEHDLYDMLLDSYKKMSSFYSYLKNDYDHEKYWNKYLSLKDSVFGYSQVSDINNMKFMGKIDKMNMKIMQMKQKREIQNIILLVVILILIIIAVTASLLYIKNKQITKKNSTLYNNYKELCNVEEKLRNKIKDEYIKSKVYNNNKQKYTNSTLSIEDRKVLLEKVIDIMENTEDIYTSDFSTERLAELVGTQYKYISQVINEDYGSSFSFLLNKYRIKEVCRRFSNTEKYGNYTTEAIAESVGFKTRATFINAFKKETGMTPYQYLKCMKEDNDSNNVINE